MDFIYGEGYDGGFFGRGRLKKNCIHVGDYFPSMESAEKRSNILLFKLAPQRIDYFDFKRSMTEQITVYRAHADIEYMFKNHPARCSFKAPVRNTKWIPLGDFPVRFSGDEFINAICLEVDTNRISVMVGARYVELKDIVRFGFYADTFAGTVAAIVDPGSTQHERDARVFKARGSKQDIEFKERAINFINSIQERSFLMVEKIDLSNVPGNHWECICNDSGCYIVHIKNNKPRAGIFCERAWLVLFFRQGDVMIESKRAYVSRSIPAISGDCRIVRLCFEEIYSNVFVDLDNQPLPEGSIERLSFYARTDAGTFVITVNPGFEKDARPVTVLVSHRDKINRTLQAMAVDWFYEIFSK